jgi:hypothetical protein
MTKTTIARRNATLGNQPLHAVSKAAYALKVWSQLSTATPGFARNAVYWETVRSVGAAFPWIDARSLVERRARWY